MKKPGILALLFSLNSFAQIAIVKADGTKINASSVEFNQEDEKITYSAPGIKKGAFSFRINSRSLF